MGLECGGSGGEISPLVQGNQTGVAMQKERGKSIDRKFTNDNITLEQFVSTMAPLIDMEKFPV
ncbi:hypothetical protein OROGR_016847 [Orobanche gracilis]